jgi:poly-gamma-glutamate synthesis protein (capsule biosynthesis protein)
MRIALAGDCMATRGSLITADPGSRALRDLLAGTDFAVANLEVVPSEGAGFPENNAAGGGCLVTGGAVLDEVRAMGFTVVGCANNHALDMGTGGLLGTMDLLRDRRMTFAGVGRNLTQARMPAYADGPRGSLAVISCTSTFRPGQEACEPSGRLPGRPGLNPLRYTMVVRVTPEQLRALTAIDQETGLLARRTETTAMLGLDPARAVPGSLSLAGTWFQVGEKPGLQAKCDARDLTEISRWVRDARQRADVVLVSVHSHEPGPAPEDPSEFFREFAHRAIENGADVVTGHGPHFLKGVEMYQGKPIFYSLGNVVSQIELGDQISAEDYARVPPDARNSPARYFATRSKNGTVLFAPHRKYWESVVPVLAFDDGDLVSAVLHPVELGFGDEVHRRGRPRLAGTRPGAEIVSELARMSAPYGTRLKTDKHDDGVVGVISGPQGEC